MSPESPRVATRVRSYARQRPVQAIVAAAAAVAVVLAVGVGALVAAGAGAADPEPEWMPAAGPPEVTPSPTPSPTPELPVITVSAVGDIVLGDAGRLPPNDGEGFFDDVVDALASDLVMGNLEQPLTDDTGFEKCAPDSEACHAFRAPPRYAAHLRDGGFDLMNLANNHGDDYGPAGRDNTRAALEEHGIAHTGERDQITVVQVRGVSVAVVGFSSYAWTNSLIDLDQAADVVSRAAEQADLVVVQSHMGAEGSDATRVSPGTETYFGENRGDVMAFSRAVVDAGADLVIGHGPHVLRGMEFYQGKLIAYSLGNFAGGGGMLRADGVLGQGAVLHVSLRADGSFAGGRLVSTHMYNAGLPAVDPEDRGLNLVRDLTASDFPDTGAVFSDDGEISAP